MKQGENSGGKMSSFTSSSGLFSDRNLKYVSLVTLTGQNAILGLSMRYSQGRRDASIHGQVSFIRYIIWTTKP
jgi:hypothetical protein